MSVTAPARRKNEPRVEDDALVRGNGRFTDDPRLPNQAYAAFVRSPHAHARIKSVDVSAALKSKGVLGVLTAADMNEANANNIARHPPVPGRGGAKMIMPPRPSIAGDKVMHVGVPVAMVVAESAALALDAADLVAVDYEPLPAVVDLEEAMKGKTQLYPEAPGNLSVDWPGAAENIENEKAVADIIGKAAHVAKISVTNQRMVVASMETRGATGVYDRQSDSYTLHVCSQGAFPMHAMATSIMGRAGRQIARHHRGRRRRLRHEDVGLSGISGVAGGGEKARPPGALAIDALGSFCHRQSGARHHHPCRTRVRRQGQIPGAARAPSVQHRRLHRGGRRQHQHQ